MLKKTIPFALTLLRIVVVPIMYALAILGLRLPFLVLFVAGGLSDILDGFLARRWKVTSEFGSSLDSFADAFFELSIIPWLYWLAPEALFNHLTLIGSLIMAYLAIITYGYVKYGRMISYHSYLGKLNAVTIFFFGAVNCGFGYTPVLVYAAATTMALFLTESCWLTFTQPRQLYNIKSVFHIRRQK